MVRPDLLKKREYAVLSEVSHLDALSFENTEHRISKWRGLRPGEGIPDDERFARTYCGKFIPLTFSPGPNDDPSLNRCKECLSEHHRISNLTKEDYEVSGEQIEALKLMGWSEERLEHLKKAVIPRRKALLEHREYWPDKLFPTVLPPMWREIPSGTRDSRVYVRKDGLRVICSCAIEEDEHWWIHVSASYKDRLPSWKDMKAVKAVFIGPKRKAINVIPPDSEFVNINPYVHHLFSPVDYDPLPDFTGGTGSI